jgi:hypothetical protein
MRRIFTLKMVNRYLKCKFLSDTGNLNKKKPSITIEAEL